MTEVEPGSVAHPPALRPRVCPVPAGDRAGQRRRHPPEHPEVGVELAHVVQERRLDVTGVPRVGRPVQRRHDGPADPDRMATVVPGEAVPGRELALVEHPGDPGCVGPSRRDRDQGAEEPAHEMHRPGHYPTTKRYSTSKNGVTIAVTRPGTMKTRRKTTSSP